MYDHWTSEYFTRILLCKTIVSEITSWQLLFSKTIGTYVLNFGTYIKVELNLFIENSVLLNLEFMLF